VGKENAGGGKLRKGKRTSPFFSAVVMGRVVWEKKAGFAKNRKKEGKHDIFVGSSQLKKEPKALLSHKAGGRVEKDSAGEGKGGGVRSQPI